jgi:hypothetical protein
MSMRKAIVAVAFAALTVLGTAGTASASGAGAVGGAADSPGILSGNNIQIPINAELNLLCGVDLSLLSALTSADGTTCVNA